MRSRLSSLFAAPLIAWMSVASLPGAARGQSFEVWLIDQSDTKGKNFGGTLYVFDGADLAGANAAAAQPRERVDLSTETSAVCMSATGANPVRPHMVLFGPEHRHAVLAFVASGHVVVYDAAARRPLTCFRTTQSPSGRQAHAAVPAPDGSFILVANQNGKRLERIDADFAANRFTYNEAYESPNMVNGFLNIALAPIDIVFGTNRPTIGRGAVKGFTLVDSVGNVRGKVDAIKPTTSKSFEVGYKGTIEKAATIDLTVFIRQDKDFIYGLLPVTNPLLNTFVADAQGMPRNEVTLSYVNLGEARLKGVDLGVRYFVTQSVHLWGAFSFQEYDNFKNIPPPILPIYANNLPKRRWKLGALCSDWWKPGTSVEVNVRHVDSFFFYHGAVAYLNGEVPGYTVVDASVEIPLEFITFAAAKLGVNGKNIFDNTHIEFPSSPLLRRLISAQVSLNL